MMAYCLGFPGSGMAADANSTSDAATLRAHAPAALLPGGLTVSFSVEQLISLRHDAAAALRVQPLVRHVKTGLAVPARAFAKLSDDDVEAIDLETTRFAGELAAPGALPLILPQSFRTVAGRRGRAALSHATRGAADVLKKRVIVELIDVDRGTPAGRLTEVAGLLNAICRGVFARLQPGRDAVAAVRDTRLQGLTLDGSDLPEVDADAAGTLLEFADQARGLAPLLVAQGLTDEGYFAVAEVAGFTHVSRRIQLEQAQAA
jgi:hypothetical protein